jgi:cytoskeletal protein CcmA (bactofilin family)
MNPRVGYLSRLPRILNAGGAMWKWDSKDGDKPVGSFSPQATHIGKSIVIKGEVFGSENVYVAGEVEGSVELLDGSLTVGPEGRVRADVQAGSIVVHGRVEGNLYGIKRVDLKRSAVLVGDIHTPRIAIEEGVYLKGSVQVQKDIPTLQAKKADESPRNQGSDASARSARKLNRVA